MSEKKANKTVEMEKPAAVYFKSLTIRDVKCFRGEHTIDLSDGEGRPAQWTVILGNNNTGKTTLLKCLAGLEAVPTWMHVKIDEDEFDEVEIIAPRVDVERFYFGFGRRSIVFSELFKCENLNINLDTHNNDFEPFDWKWGRGSDTSYQSESFAKQLMIEAYGVNRLSTVTDIDFETGSISRHSSLLANSDTSNTEEWLLQLNLAALQGDEVSSFRAKDLLSKIEEILTCGLLPDVKKTQVKTIEVNRSFKNFIEFQTEYGWIRLRDLGYGYQTMLAWVLDLVRRMFERYPDSPNPIREPAIVLVDEIDLHLHPEWQRKIISHLTKYFPNTQFIVTAHSPLVVQSAEKINLVLLEKDGDHVNIKQPKIPSYQGWSLEEILTELMGLGERTHSEKYLELMRQFETALDEEDYESAQAAYDELDKILHPESHQRKLLRLQMSSLAPA